MEKRDLTKTLKRRLDFPEGKRRRPEEHSIGDKKGSAWKLEYESAPSYPARYGRTGGNRAKTKGSMAGKRRHEGSRFRKNTQSRKKRARIRSLLQSL